MHPKPEEARTALAKALSEAHIETISAEHDLQRTINQGHDFIQSRYSAERLQEHPEQLDAWSGQMAQSQTAIQRHGIGNLPELPYTPAFFPV